jgi:hypothetical protein
VALCVVALALETREGATVWVLAVAGSLAAIALGLLRLISALVENQRLLEQRDGALKLANEHGARYQQILETTSEGVWIVDAENRTTFANARMADMLGTSPVSLLGKPILDFIPQDDQEPAVFQGSDDGHHREGPLRRADGKEIWTLTSTTSILGRDGEYAGAVVMVSDISARRRAEQEIRFQAGLLDHVNAALVAVDVEGRITYWNSGAEELYGWSAEETHGRVAAKLLAPDLDEEALLRFRAAAEAGGGELQVALTRRDGSELIADARNAAIHDADGELLGYVWMTVDATERIQVEEASRLLASVVESASVAIVSTDADGIITSWNAGACELYGWSTDEAVGQPIEWLIGEEENLERDLRRRVIEDGARVPPFESTRQGRDGVLVEVTVNVSPVVAEDGQVVGAASMAYDVTKRKRSERVAAAQHVGAAAGGAGRTVEEAMDYLLPALRAIGGYVGATGTVRTASAAVEARSGAVPDADGTDPSLRAPIVHDDTLLGELVLFGSRAEDGAFADALESAAAQFAQFVVRREVEEALRVTDERLHAILAHTPAQIYVKDRDRRYVLANPELRDELGYIEDELLGLTDEDIYDDPGLVTMLRDADERALRGESVHLEVPMPDGDDRIFSSLKFPLRDSSGIPYAVCCIAWDMTDARRAELARRESEERYRRIVETANEGVWIIDADHRTTFANTRMAEMLGVAGDDLTGRPMADFTEPGTSPAAIAAVERGRESGAAEVADARLVRADGTSFDALISSSPLFDDAGRYAGALGMVTDISDRMRAQEENAKLQEHLHQAQKLESVGQLAGGIAHDFNNLLAVILNYAEFAAEDVDAPDQLQEDIDAIREAADRATELTRQLLIFSRREPVAPVAFDVNTVVERTERLLGRTLGEHIKLVTDLAPELPWVFADVGQLEQVLMNLAVNGRDAIGTAGTIRMRTDEVEVEAAQAALLKVEPGGFARVTVTDDGSGMPPEVAARAFEPFFSTKSRGSGTGLGLATVYGIVRQVGGAIELSSEEGSGTVVEVFLPIATATEHVTGVGATLPAGPGSGQSVMVVEDEDNVREVTCRTLRRNGYDVLAARNAADARALWEEHAGRVDLVLTDVVMPGDSGKVLVDELKAQEPDLCCVFMSGYTDDVLTQHGATSDGATLLLEKPFSRDALLRTVETAIKRGRDQ